MTEIRKAITECLDNPGCEVFVKCDWDTPLKDLIEFDSLVELVNIHRMFGASSWCGLELVFINGSVLKIGRKMRDK